MNTTEIAVASLEASRMNPRRTMDKTSLKELAASIRTNGLLQPLLVRPTDETKSKGRYEVVCGHRRLLALREAGVEKCAVSIRELTDDEAADAQQVENLQREDVPPLEEGEALAALVKKHGLEKVASRIGKSAAFIRRRIMLTRLTGEARKLLQAGQLPLKSAELIAAVEDEAIRKELCGDPHLLSGSTAEIAHYLQREILLRLAAAPFNKAKVYGCPDEEGRTCADCPFNTGAAKGQLFPELAKEARCMNAKCFRAKAEAEFERKAQAHTAAGGGVLDEKDIKKCWPYQGGYFHDSAFILLENIQPVARAAKCEIAAKHVFLARNPHSYEIKLVVPRPVAAEIWHKAKVATNGHAAHDEDGKQRRRRERIESEKRKAVRLAYVKALGTVTALDAKLYRAMAAALAEEMGHDAWRVIFAARSIDRPKGTTWEQEQKLKRKTVTDLDKSQLAGFILQCLALVVEPYSTDAHTRAIAGAAAINGSKLEETTAKEIRERFTAKNAATKPVAVSPRQSSAASTVSAARRAA